MRQVEVLAPAGSFESMKAAIGAGADAVYMGGTRFGARAYADNPDEEKLLEAIDYVHLHGAALYMTVNTLMKEQELRELEEYLRPVYERGLDGVIVQDLGAVAYIQEHFPGLPVHGSTQMTITGVYGARMLWKMGIKRVVPARELSLDEIRRIHRDVPIEIESFVHGALCYCYSGQCLLSSLIGGRSGNRGRCAQPCRLPYEVVGEERGSGQTGRGKNRRNRASGSALEDKQADYRTARQKDNGYLLSMKDLCTLDLLPDLIEAGICSFKIEGRMKSPRYTAGVVEVYRKYVDRYLENGREGYRVDSADRQMLLDLFDRGGFTEGYYRQHNGADMIARKEKPAFRQANQELFDRLDRMYVEREKKEPVQGMLEVKEGKPVSLKLSLMKGQEDESGATPGPQITVLGPYVETARSQPVTEEQLARQLKKTGNTPFEFERLDICLEGQGFLPVQALKELRREGLAQLQEAVLEPYRREWKSKEQREENSAEAKGSGNSEDVGKAESTDDSECVKKAESFGDSDCVRKVESTDESECIKKVESHGDIGCTRSTENPSEWKEKAKAREMPALHVLLPDLDRFPRVLSIPHVTEIIIEGDGGKPETWSRQVTRCHEHGKSCVLAMPVIFRTHGEKYFDRYLNQLIDAGFDGILVRAWEEIEYLQEKGVKLPLYGDHNLYSFNSRAQKQLLGLGLERTTFPLELNSRELEELGGERRELIGYGYLPAMVSAQCVQRTTSGCTGKPGRLLMKDRTGKELPVENHCTYCYNIIYNPSPLSLMDQKERIQKLAPEAVRLQFAWESAGEIEQTVHGWVKALWGQEEDRGSWKNSGNKEFTRGHFKRGVE